jgi:hypothetical protein
MADVFVEELVPDRIEVVGDVTSLKETKIISRSFNPGNETSIVF